MAHNGTQHRNLTAKQQRAVAALLLSGNVQHAAVTSGVGRRTLCRWLNDPSFRSALDDAQRDVVNSAVRRLAGLAERAIDSIERMLGNGEVPDAVRLRAALGALDQALKWRGQVDVENRLAALEERLGR